MSLPDLSARAQPGAVLNVRVTPKARRNVIEPGETLRIRVTAAPDKGKANDAVRKLLSHALGIAPSRLMLIRGATARDKQFQVD